MVFVAGDGAVLFVVFVCSFSLLVCFWFRLVVVVVVVAYLLCWWVSSLVAVFAVRMLRTAGAMDSESTAP